MRILALFSLLVALGCVFGVTATALGQDDVKTPATTTVTADVPPLLPMTVSPQPTASSVSTSATDFDEPVAIAALYWLLLGGLALLRASHSSSCPAIDAARTTSSF